jgi:hypothetical protein
MFLNRYDLWGVVNGIDIDPRTTDLVTQVAWKFRDLKTYSDLIFHYGDHQIQLIWAKLKSTYEHKDSASQVGIHKSIFSFSIWIAITD